MAERLSPEVHVPMVVNFQVDGETLATMEEKIKSNPRKANAGTR